jgi:hypothetical protein
LRFGAGDSGAFAAGSFASAYGASHRIIVSAERTQTVSISVGSVEIELWRIHPDNPIQAEYPTLFEHWS